MTIEEEGLALGPLALALHEELDVGEGLEPATAADALLCLLNVDRLAFLPPRLDLGGLGVKRRLRRAAGTTLVKRQDVDVVRGEAAEVVVVALNVLGEAVDEDNIRLGVRGGPLSCQR